MAHLSTKDGWPDYLKPCYRVRCKPHTVQATVLATVTDSVTPVTASQRAPNAIVGVDRAAFGRADGTRCFDKGVFDLTTARSASGGSA